MKNMLKKWCFMGIFLIFMNAAVTGCSGEKNDHPSESEKEEKLIEDTLQKSEEPLYPVLIDDIEILIGETTIQSLLDNGLRMDIFETTPSYEYYEHEIDPEEKLKANSSYSGFSIHLTDSVYAFVSIATDEEAVKMGDAVIASMNFSFADGDKADFARIAFNNIPLTELNREKAEEIFPDFTGNENILFSPFDMKEYRYFMEFDLQNDGLLTRLTLEKKYDTD